VLFTSMVALTKATKSSSFFSDFLAVEIHCDAMASALSSKQARNAMALSGTDPPSSARMAGAGKTHLAERPVDHEQLLETPPPPPPRDAVMIARRTSMRIADGGPRIRLSGNQRSPWQVRCAIQSYLRSLRME